MVVHTNDYPRTIEPHKHEGEGEFVAETILSKEDMGQAGRLFVRGTLKSGHSVGMHAHQGDMEICYFLSGHGLVLEPDGETPVTAGDVNVVPSGASHEIRNVGKEDLVYLAVVIFPQGRRG